MIILYSPEVIDSLDRKIIEEKRKRLINLGSAEKAIIDKRIHLIKKEAFNHSYHIENRERELRRVGRTDEPQRKYHENVTLLNEAWHFISKLKKEELDLESLVKVNEILEPSSSGLRTTRVSVTNSQVSRPNPSSLLDRLEEAFEVAENLETLDASLFLSQRLLYIHPFSDGNGRTIRLYANALLNSDSYPSIVIPESERSFYFSTLERSLIGQKNRTSSSNPKLEQEISDSESVFYQYLLSKINTGFDDLIDYSNKNKKTSIFLDFSGKSDKSFYILLMRRFKTVAKNRGFDITASYKNNNSKDGRHIEIRGDIPSQVIQTILDSTENLKKYEVREG